MCFRSQEYLPTKGSISGKHLISLCLNMSNVNFLSYDFHKLQALMYQWATEQFQNNRFLSSQFTISVRRKEVYQEFLVLRVPREKVVVDVDNGVAKLFNTCGP